MQAIALSKNVNLVAALGIVTNDPTETRLKVWGIGATEQDAADEAAAAFVKAYKLTEPSTHFVESIRFRGVTRVVLTEERP